MKMFEVGDKVTQINNLGFSDGDTFKTIGEFKRKNEICNYSMNPNEIFVIMNDGTICSLSGIKHYSG